MKSFENPLKFLLVLITSFWIQQVVGQSPYYYSLNEENGLPSNEVYQVKQDKRGYIWIACDAGLFRYDGTQFKKYSSRLENARSVSELKFDKLGRLWCQNFSGQIFYVKGDSLQLFLDFSTVFRTYPQYTIDDNNRVWVAGESKIFAFDSLAHPIDLHLENFSYSEFSWFDIDFSAKNQLIVTVHDKGIGQLIETAPNRFKIKWLVNHVGYFMQPFIENRPEGLYVLGESSSKKNYTLIKWTGNEITTLIDNQKFPFLIYKIGLDASGHQWISTSNGVFNYDEKQRTIDTSNWLYRNDKISSVFLDREGNLWLTSLENGIHILPNEQLRITDKSNSPISDHLITSVSLGNDNSIVFGTYNGLLYHLKNNQIHPIKREAGKELRAVKRLIPYKDGYLVASGRVSFINGQQEKVLLLKNLRDFILVHDTLYIVGTDRVAMVPNLAAVIAHPEKIPTMVYLPRGGRTLARDESDGRIYFGTNNGLISLQRDHFDSVLFNHQRINVSKLAYGYGKLWIGTYNQGILSITNGQVINEEKINQRIKGSTVKSVYCIDSTLYIATDICLHKFHLASGKCEYLDQSDGMTTREINGMVALGAKIYLATNKGLISFPKQLKTINTVSPDISLKAVFVNGSHLNSTDFVTAPYNNNHIRIVFETSCIRARGNFGYEYRLNGIDTAWTQLKSKNNEVIFTSLSPGTYTLEVRSFNEDGIVSVKSEHVIIAVDKPFWQQLWFYFLTGLSGALVVWVISWRIIVLNNRRAETRNQLISSQLTAIKAQMNPHFMYNTLNSIQDLILHDEIKKTNYYLSRFSSLMRKILDFSQRDYVTIEEESEMLESYLELEKLRFGTDFSFSIQCENNGALLQKNIPSMVVQPFVENAIKHGLLHRKGDKQLLINFKAVAGGALISVEDNGIGRQRAAEIQARNQLTHRSFASGAVMNRLQLINRSFKIPVRLDIHDLEVDGQPAGTRVELFIPDNSSHS